VGLLRWRFDCNNGLNGLVHSAARPYEEITSEMIHTLKNGANMQSMADTPQCPFDEYILLSAQATFSRGPTASSIKSPSFVFKCHFYRLRLDTGPYLTRNAL